jgi:lysyl-tRNA synthetase class 2
VLLALALAGTAAARAPESVRKQVEASMLLTGSIDIAPDGSVGGFIQLVPAPACGGYSLASMRRRRETPNGLMEFLIVETIAWAREHDVSEVSLNFSVFAEYLRADRGLFRALLLKFDRLFQLERLHSFNRKFFPQWRRRDFCFERWTDLPVAGFAYLQAEQLLTPPGPWAAKTPDLAAQ